MRKASRRVDSMETVMKVGDINDAPGTNYAISIKRVVFREEEKRPPVMVVDVYKCHADGSYDSENDRVIKMRGVDTLELQCLLIELKHMISTLTGVHINH